MRAPRPSSQCRRIHPATCAASSSAVSRRAACTAPRPGAGLGPQHLHGDRRLQPQRLGRQRWPPARIASSLRQLVESGSSSAAPGAVGELDREAGQRGRARSRASRRSTGCGSPTAVTGTGDAGRDEEALQQHELGLAGVLELVQQHGPEALPLDRADVGERAGQPRRQGHLVGEVQGVAAALEVEVGARPAAAPRGRARSAVRASLTSPWAGPRPGWRPWAGRATRASNAST